MRSQAAALAGRLGRHHADAVICLSRPAVSAAEGCVYLLPARVASSWTAGPLTPPPPPAWSTQTGRGLGARPYSSSSTLDHEAAAAPAAPAAPASPRPALTLTPAAAGRVRDLLARPDAVAAGHTALRLTVEAGGCSGFSYVFAMDTGPQKGDTVVGDDEGGTTPLLMVDPVSLGLVRGGTVDFVSELIKAGFEVTVNPNADAGCGCGASFTPKL